MTPVLVSAASVAASGLFLLALVGRTLCNLGFVERPIVLGFLWFLCSGEYAPTLPLAIFFELFWLDLFAIGSYLPPMAAFPYLILMALATNQGWNTPEALAFPLFFSLPLAYLQPKLEEYLRILHTNAYTQIMGRARHSAPLGQLPGRLILLAGVWHLGFSLALFALVLGLATQGLLWVSPWTPPTLTVVSWPVVYGIAALGALMASRINRAYSVFAACMGCMAIATFV